MILVLQIVFRAIFRTTVFCLTSSFSMVFVLKDRRDKLIKPKKTDSLSDSFRTLLFSYDSTVVDKYETVVGT